MEVMKISIKTTANEGHLACYLIDNKGTKILVLKNTDSKSSTLISGVEYKFEWHVWSSSSANYKIEVLVVPSSEGFPPFEWEKPYENDHEDMGGFYFTV